MLSVLSPRLKPSKLAPRLAGALALTLVPLAMLLAFLWAPTATITLQAPGSPEQLDLPQKIFYLHVPIAFAAYWGFFVGAWNALLYILRGDARYDTRSYVGIHVGLVFGTLVLATGAIWARAAWGVWWQWGDRQLLVFLILFLFYCAYTMVRFSLPEGTGRARVSAILAMFGVVLVPMSFLAVRIADTLIHPTVITSDGLQMTAQMAATFLISSAGFIALATWMMQIEVHAKLLAAARRVQGAPVRRPVQPRQPDASAEPKVLEPQP